MKKALTLTLMIGLMSAALVRVNDAARAQMRAGAENLRVAGLRAVVTVQRDERGIPYIEAANDHDLYFAQGYVTASDRLWQMDLLRRTIRGELSEIFGKTAFEEDKRRRTLGYAKQSEELAAKTTGETRATMQAYADGVNAYLAACEPAKFPAEFRILKYQPRQWTVADSLALAFLMMESLSTTWQADVMRAALGDLPAAQREELLMEFTDMIADPSNWDNSQHGLTLGESGDPQSPHYTDQLNDWRNVTPRAFPFSAAAVRRAAQQTLTLQSAN